MKKDVSIINVKKQIQTSKNKIYELIVKLTIFISNVLCYQYMYGTFSTFFSYLINFDIAKNSAINK